MRTLAFALLFVCAISTAPHAQNTGTSSAGHWAGCYELRVDPKDSEKQTWGKVPRRVELLTEQVDRKSFPNEFRMNTLDATGQHWISFWSPQGETVVELIFSTGVAGYHLGLTGTGELLVGTAEPFSDDGNSHPKFKVTARRHSCPPLR